MQEPGPFQRVVQTDSSPSRDRAAAIIVAAGIVLGLFMLILVLPPISILDNGGEESAPTGPVTATEREEMPPAPPGFESVSALYDLSSTEPVNRAATVGVELTSEQAADEELFLYTYQDDTWTQVGTATVVADGQAASGDVDPLPSNVAVFRRSDEAARMIIGSLPANAEPDQDTLAELTVLSPQGYTLSDDGSVGGSVNVPDGISIDVIPTIGAGNADALGGLISSEDGRFANIDAIMALINDNGYAGVDLDYRIMNADDGENLVHLVTGLSDQMHQADKKLILTLPAPVQRDSDWDTRGFDWDALASLADQLKVVPDGDPGTYYVTLDSALSYLVPRVGASKLSVAVDSLSREQSSEGVRSLSLTEALTIASTPAMEGQSPVESGGDVAVYGQNLAEQSGGSVPHWDDTAKAVTFAYVGAGGQRTIWLTNSFSESAKLELAQRYQIGGVGIQDVSASAADSNIRAPVAQFASGATVEVAQPNGELLAPHWTASDGTLEDEAGATNTWHAPDGAGEYTITLIVSDGATRLGQELHITVGS